MYFLGFGLSLRPTHYDAILTEKPAVDWFEILTENYLTAGGKSRDYLEKIRAHYPIVMHGVSLSLGSTDPLDQTYLKQLKTLMQQLKPEWVSDHVCWTGIQHKNTHDLLPLPYTEEAVNHIATRIQQVQDYLGQQILIENVSSYVTYTHSTLTEWEFIKEICTRADCYLLLDVNNIYVSASNHHFNPINYMQAIPVKRVQQIHLAGHTNKGDYMIDTHDQAIITPVWELYAAALTRFGRVSTMIERDDHIPPLKDLLIELNQARQIAASVWQEAVFER
jgi:uncharacterized protein (UPF0276 family)